jgi:predicted TIM-barrel fold metal-dependent hydrolase
MLGDIAVVDAVVHPYDLGPANRDEAARTQLDSVYAAHRLSMDDAHDRYRLTRAEFFTDFGFDAMADALFRESPVDVAVLHALPNLGFAHGNVTDPRRAADLRDRHPGRFRLYATVDTPILDAAIAQLEWQVRELGVDGLKLYPSFFYDGIAQGWRLDDTDYATPLLEAALDLGIRNVAIHKAMVLPPAPKEAFAVGDLASPLGRFPTLNFQIVHAGVSFRAETMALLREHPNLYATLESTFSFILVRPRVFAEVLAALLQAAGSGRLMFASGANLMHPRPLLEAFAGYELPDDLVEQGCPQLTEGDRANILGRTALGLYGAEPDEALAAIAGDAFDAAGPEFSEPWSALRSGAGAR